MSLLGSTFLIFGVKNQLINSNIVVQKGDFLQ